MTTVNTSQCSTATRLTKIRKKKKMALLFLQGEELSEMRREKTRGWHTSCVFRPLSLGALPSPFKATV